MAAVGHDVDVVLHGSGDHDDHHDDDDATTPDLQALMDISEFADAPDFCLPEEEDLSVSDRDADYKDKLQAEMIVVPSTKYYPLYRRLRMVLT